MRREPAAWLDAGVNRRVGPGGARLSWSGSGLLLLGLLTLAGPCAGAQGPALVEPGSVRSAPAQPLDEEGLLRSPALTGLLAGEREVESLRTRRGAAPLAPRSSRTTPPCLPCADAVAPRAPARSRPFVRPQLLPRAPPRP